MFPENLTSLYSLQNGFMFEASLRISPAGCGQIVTMFITLNRTVYFDQILLIHMQNDDGPTGRVQKLKMLIHVTFESHGMLAQITITLSRH